MIKIWSGVKIDQNPISCTSSTEIQKIRKFEERNIYIYMCVCHIYIYMWCVSSVCLMYHVCIAPPGPGEDDEDLRMVWGPGSAG